MGDFAKHTAAIFVAVVLACSINSLSIEAVRQQRSQLEVDRARQQDERLREVERTVGNLRLELYQLTNRINQQQ